MTSIRWAANDPRLKKLADRAGAVEKPRRGKMNKLEKRFSREFLEPQRLAGQIAWWRFEAVTLTLFDGSSDVRKSRYTPDFVVHRPNGLRPWLLECKGFRHPAGIVRIKSAAQQYGGMFDIALVEWKNGEFVFSWLC